MAVLPEVPGLKVEVCVNGSPLQEYDHDEPAQANTVTKYIEAVSDANFCIKYAADHSYLSTHGVEAEIHIDGRYMTAHLHNLTSFKQPKGFERTGKLGFRAGKTFRSRFRFSSLALDNGRKLSQQEKKMLKSTGIIVVEFKHIENIRKKGPGTSFNLLRETASLPEKAVQSRSLTHYTELQPAELDPEHSGQVSEADYIDEEKKPFARYCFKYRSYAGLQSLGIIPRPPTPVPLEERPTNELSQEEMIELINCMRERESQMAVEVKRETQDSARYKRGYASDEDDDEVSFVSKRHRNKRVIPGQDDIVIELD